MRFESIRTDYQQTITKSIRGVPHGVSVNQIEHDVLVETEAKEAYSFGTTWYRPGESWCASTNPSGRGQARAKPERHLASEASQARGQNLNKMAGEMKQDWPTRS
jgi:hypothetical protein